MGAAEMFPIGNVGPFGPFVPCRANGLLGVIYLDNGTGIVDGGLLSYVSIGHAVIALVQKK